MCACATRLTVCGKSLYVPRLPPPCLRNMTTLRPFRCDDLFHYNNVNLDPLTETYNLAFYLMYLARYLYTTVPVK